MNYSVKIPSSIIILIISVLSVSSCKKAKLPSVTTVTVTRIQQRSAYSGGQITSDGDAHISAMGVCWNSTPDPDLTNSKTSDTTSTGVFISHITGLEASTMYYLRAYATNSEGTAYGEPVSFTTDAPAIPTLTTSPLKSVTLTTAAGGGDITNDGGIQVTDRGVCWNITGNPTITDAHTSDGGGDGLFSSTLTELTLNTTYFVRAYATNSLGTSYGDELEYKQVEPVTDNDGNAYRIVTIGTQVWMAENLRTTTFNDGTAITNVSAGNQWATTSSPAFCWYNNSETDVKDPYGALYNWYAVNTGKLCPTGWHVPTLAEYAYLIALLDGDKIAGGKLKEAGTAHWFDPNVGATNGSGFTALPGGGRYNYYSQPGIFADLSYYGYLWSASASTNEALAVSFDLAYYSNQIHQGEYSKGDGESVRCIQDSH